MNKFFYFILFSLLLLPVGLAVNVSIESYVGLNTTIFNYSISFANSDNYNSFSFEKPSNSRIISTKDKFGNKIPYSIAGDYFIFRLTNPNNNTFDICFKTDSISNDLKNNDIFKTYINFNIPISNLIFKLKFKDFNVKIKDIFPREYSIENGDIYIWKMDEIKKDLLFMVSLNMNSNKSNLDYNFKNGLFSFFSSKIFLVSVIVVILILFLLYYFRTLFINLIKLNLEVLKNQSNSTIKNKKNDLIKEVKIGELDDDLEKNSKNEVTFEDFIKKYLTENEEEVVLLVKENPGITQNNILNNIGHLKKSNLSKIITKLDGKKILNRVRVGKVTKIYLGEKLEKFENN